MRRLLIRPGAIGDFLVSLPAMESLRASYTEVWCSTPNVSLARFADCARSITAVGLNRLGLLNDEDVTGRVRQFDDVISWYGANRSEFRDYVAGLNLPFRFLTALPGKAHHAVEFYNSQARGLGGLPSRFPRVFVPASKRTFAVIHPLASSARKQFPLEWFQVAASRLEKHMPVEWITGPERFPDLYELACWLAGARVYVGNDSGISHLAASVGTPVCALFPASDSRIWCPRGLGWAVSQVPGCGSPASE